MKKLVLYGAGGLGRELAYLTERINRQSATWELLGFVVDAEYYTPGVVVDGYPILGDESWLLAHKEEVFCVCAIGQPDARARIQTELTEQGVEFATLLAPDVEIPPTSRVGKGVIIQSQTLVSVGVSIGDGVLLNGSCFLGHDVCIDEFVCIMSKCSLNSFVHVGRGVYMGGAAYIVPHVDIGDGATVAAGSVVFHRIKPGTHVLGNPARRINL